MADIGWGWLSHLESFGRLGDDEREFKVIDAEEAKTTYAEYMHASHGMIFARCDAILWELYPIRGSVLMQLRFDGVMGFPGGLVETGEDPADALNREMEEEIGLNVELHKFTEKDRIQIYVHDSKKLVLHFYVMEVTIEEFGTLEANALKAPEYGVETFGLVRVPLHTMGDGLRGLPAFLTNQFAGNARSELLLGLESTKLLTGEELKEAVQNSSRYLAQKLGKNKCEL